MVRLHNVAEFVNNHIVDAIASSSYEPRVQDDPSPWSATSPPLSHQADHEVWFSNPKAIGDRRCRLIALPKDFGGALAHPLPHNLGCPRFVIRPAALDHQASRLYPCTVLSTRLDLQPILPPEVSVCFASDERPRWRFWFILGKPPLLAQNPTCAPLHPLVDSAAVHA